MGNISFVKLGEEEWYVCVMQEHNNHCNKYREESNGEICTLKQLELINIASRQTLLTRIMSNVITLPHIPGCGSLHFIKRFLHLGK